MTPEELKEAIRIYGGHMGYCHPATPCKCGFKAIWDKLFPKENKQ